MPHTMWRGPPPPFYPSSEHTAKDRCVLSEVIPSRLYLTNFKGAADKLALQFLKVTHIASVGDEFEDPAIDGLIHWTKNITDEEHQGDVMAVALRDGARFIHDAIEGEGCVVVHCAAEISRSATFLLGYYILHGGRSLREAFAHVFACRPCIWPNEGFMAALVDLERAVRGSISLTTAEYEHWGEYEGPEEGDEAAPNMPPPRLVRDDTCLDAEERELEALEAEASIQREVQQQEERRKLLASPGDSTDAAEVAEGHFGTGGDEGFLSLGSRLRGSTASEASVAIVGGPSEARGGEGTSMESSGTPGGRRVTMTRKERQSAARRASDDAREHRKASCESVSEHSSFSTRSSSAGSLLGTATRRVRQLQLKRIIVSWLARKKYQPVEPEPSVHCAGAAAPPPSAQVGDATAKEVKPPKKPSQRASLTVFLAARAKRERQIETERQARAKPKPKQKKGAARKITPQ